MLPDVTFTRKGKPKIVDVSQGSKNAARRQLAAVLGECNGGSPKSRIGYGFFQAKPVPAMEAPGVRAVPAARTLSKES
jgi:hypothetical protein